MEVDEEDPSDSDSWPVRRYIPGLKSISLNSFVDWVISTDSFFKPGALDSSGSIYRSKLELLHTYLNSIPHAYQSKFVRNFLHRVSSTYYVNSSYNSLLGVLLLDHVHSLCLTDHFQDECEADIKLIDIFRQSSTFKQSDVLKILNWNSHNHLSELHFSRCSEGILAILNKLPELSSLCIEILDDSDKEAYITHCGELVKILISKKEVITKLHLSAVSFGDISVNLVQNLKQLESLNLDATNITATDMASLICTLPHLSSLYWFYHQFGEVDDSSDPTEESLLQLYNTVQYSCPHGDCFKTKIKTWLSPITFAALTKMPEDLLKLLNLKHNSIVASPPPLLSTPPDAISINFYGETQNLDDGGDEMFSYTIVGNFGLVNRIEKWSKLYPLEHLARLNGNQITELKFHTDNASKTTASYLLRIIYNCVNIEKLTLHKVIWTGDVSDVELVPLPRLKEVRITCGAGNGYRGLAAYEHQFSNGNFVEADFIRQLLASAEYIEKIELMLSSCRLSSLQLSQILCRKFLHLRHLYISGSAISLGLSDFQFIRRNSPRLEYFGNINCFWNLTKEERNVVIEQQNRENWLLRLNVEDRD